MNQKRGIQKKNRIMQVALKLFVQKGYETVGVRDIAARAQVNLSMINYYFGSKKGLYQSLLNYYFTELVRVIKPVTDFCRSPEAPKKDAYLAFLNSVFAQSIEWRIAHWDYHLLIQQETLRKQSLSRALQERYLDSLLNPMIELFKLGQTRGWITPNLEPFFLLMSILGELDQIILWTHWPSEYGQKCRSLVKDPQALAQHVLKTIWRGD